MENDILERSKIHYTHKHLSPEMFDGNFCDANWDLELEMANDPKLACRVIDEYWDDYFKNRPLYS